MSNSKMNIEVAVIQRDSCLMVCLQVLQLPTEEPQALGLQPASIFKGFPQQAHPEVGGSGRQHCTESERGCVVTQIPKPDWVLPSYFLYQQSTADTRGYRGEQK